MRATLAVTVPRVCPSAVIVTGVGAKVSGSMAHPVTTTPVEPECSESRAPNGTPLVTAPAAVVANAETARALVTRPAVSRVAREIERGMGGLFRVRRQVRPSEL